MKHLLGFFLFLLILAPALPAYEWYTVPLAPVELPVYEIQFGPDLAYAGSEAGVFRGMGWYDPWEGMGLEYPSVGARTLLVLSSEGKDHSEIYCGFGDCLGISYSDGIYHWQELSQEWWPVWWCPHPFFLVEHPLVPGRIFCGNKDGLFVSEDLEHWVESGAAILPDSVRCIAFHPEVPEQMMVGTEYGLYKSHPEDPGWELVEGFPLLPVMDIECIGSLGGPEPFMIFVAAGNGSFSDGVYRSLDLGFNWEPIFHVPEPRDLLEDFVANYMNDVALFVGTAGDGILRVDWEGHLLGDLNAGLASMSVHRMRYDPYIDTPAIYGRSDAALQLCMLLETSTAVQSVEVQRGVQVWPNPAPGSISFQAAGLPSQTPVGLRVFDLAGRQVWSSDGRSSSHGHWEVRWEGCDSWGRRLPAGVYFYHCETGQELRSGKLVLVR